MEQTDDRTTFKPLTKENWPDFETLFGPNGAYGGCWCMWWRQTRADFDRFHGEENRQKMCELVNRGEIPGILAYLDDDPVGWCSVAPREQFSSLNRSRVLKPIDDQTVWSIVCFYVAKKQRGQGLIVDLIKAAVDYVDEMGGKIVEAYPTLPRGKRLAPVSTFMGFPEVFERAGFQQCAQPTEARAIMRCWITQPTTGEK